jgi:hypothetical protein
MKKRTMKRGDNKYPFIGIRVSPFMEFCKTQMTAKGDNRVSGQLLSTCTSPDQIFEMFTRWLKAIREEPGYKIYRRDDIGIVLITRPEEDNNE